MLKEDVIEGKLSCPSCAKEYQITNGIPRFVTAEENYAENFGYQWQQFSAIQIDRLSGYGLSNFRLLNDTRWLPEWINGKRRNQETRNFRTGPWHGA